MRAVEVALEQQQQLNQVLSDCGVRLTGNEALCLGCRQRVVSLSNCGNVMRMRCRRARLIFAKFRCDMTLPLLIALAPADGTV